MKISILAAGVLIALGVATQARAVPITLTLDTSGTVSIQQAANRPCVIGDPSCANPGGFPWTTLSASASTYTDIGSPIYTVGQIRALVGNLFSVGIDVNTTGSSVLANEVLDSFSLAINGTTEFLFNTSTQLHVNNPGNGFSDDILNGFNISGFAADASAQFFVTYHDAVAGREQFFLSANTPPPTGGVPEPATLALLGLGLAALGLRVRARRSY